MCLSHFRKIPAKSLTLEMELPSPHHYVYLDRVCSSHQLQKKERKKKKSKQLPSPKICCQNQQKREGEAWRDVRILAQFPDKGSREEQRSGTQV